MTGAEIFNALLQRGYSPEHAAALGGHALQESGGDPTKVNRDEDAHGLYQWRGDRWTGLQNYALSRKASPDDPSVQLDYIAKEMAGPEAKSGAAFMAAKDLPSASAALKGFIRYGDNSDDVRLKNGQALLAGHTGSIAHGDAPSGARTMAVANGNDSPANPAGQPGPTEDPLTTALQKIPKDLAQPAEAPQIAPIQMPDGTLPAPLQRARQIASAMISKSMNPGTPT
jgi:Phage tail lysozyme